MKRSSVALAAPPPPLDQLLREIAREHQLFPRPGTALLAVSGGPDSVALLDLMSLVAPDFGLRLAVGHVDHGIAGDSSDVAEQVMGLAVQYELPGYLEVLKLGPDSSETNSREHRYLALERISKAIGAGYLVTAHQLDDQVETVLIRMLKGSGPAGLAGIEMKGPKGLIRPLLQFRREDLRSWLNFRFHQRGERLPIHTDPANFDSKHERSWVRQKLLPDLRARLGEDFDTRLLEVGRKARQHRRAWSALLRQVKEFEAKIADDSVEVARSPLRGYDDHLGEVLLQVAAREIGLVLGTEKARRLLEFARQAQSGRQMQLGNGWVGEIVFARIRIGRVSSPALQDQLRWGESDGGEVTFGEWRLRWRSDTAGKVERGGLSTWVTPGSGILRSLEPGDRLIPLGGPGRRKASRLMMEAGVPLSERRRYPILLRSDEIFWIPGVCRAEAFLPQPGEPALRLDAEPS